MQRPQEPELAPVGALVLLTVAADLPLPQGFLDGRRQFLALPGNDCAMQFLAQQGLERLGQLALDRVVVPDRQARR